MSHARTAVLVLAALLASCGSQPRHVEPKPQAPVAPPAPAGVTIAAVGDIMMGTDYPENILPDDDAVGFLSGVAPVISAADVAFGNLEGVLMDGGEAVKRCKPASKRKGGTTHAPPAAPPPGPAVAPPTESSPTTPTAAPTSPSSPAPATVPPAAPSPSTPAAAPSPAPGEPQAASPPGSPTEPAAQNGEGEPGAAATAPDSRAPGKDTAASKDTGRPPDQSETRPDASVPQQPESPSAAAPPTVQPPAAAGSCYVFRSPTRYATWLRDAGFDVLSLANNHAQDFGDPGRDSSMRALDDVGIRHSGREGDVAEWTAQGRRLALVAFAPNVGSHQLNDLPHARQIVADLAAHHDIVIVSFHGGGEGEGASALPFAHEIYQGEDRGDVVEFAHTVIDAGADLVIGHGPHVLRAMELYRDRLVAYSLGNFATYYGISVNGIRGIAGILTTRLAGDGRFLEARLDSTIQIRPAGPTLDPERRAATHLRELTAEAFPAGQLTIADDGRIARTQ